MVTTIATSMFNILRSSGKCCAFSVCVESMCSLFLCLIMPWIHAAHVFDVKVMGNISLFCLCFVYLDLFSYVAACWATIDCDHPDHKMVHVVTQNSLATVNSRWSAMLEKDQRRCGVGAWKQAHWLTHSSRWMLTSKQTGRGNKPWHWINKQLSTIPALHDRLSHGENNRAEIGRDRSTRSV